MHGSGHLCGTRRRSVFEQTGRNLSEDLASRSRVVVELGWSILGSGAAHRLSLMARRFCAARLFGAGVAICSGSSCDVHAVVIERVRDMDSNDRDRRMQLRSGEPSPQYALARHYRVHSRQRCRDDLPI